jgi:hypothetical protein
MRLCRAVELAIGNAALRTDRSPRGIDADPLHQGEIDDYTSVADCISGDVVATTPHRQNQLMIAGEVHPSDDVGHPGAASDQRWASIYHRIEDLPHRVITLITGAD